MRQTFVNLGSVLGGEAAIRAVNLFAVLVIARVYGAAILGLYGTCLAAATIVVMFADNGLQTAAITELRSGNSRFSEISGQLYLSKTVLSLVALLLLAGLALSRNFSPLYWLIGGTIALRTVMQSYSQLQVAILKSLNRMHWIGIVQAAHAIVLAAAVLLAAIKHWPLEVLLFILLAGQILEFILMSLAVTRLGISPSWPGFSDSMLLALKSTPLGVTYALANLIVRLDVLIVSTLFPLIAVGVFSAASNLLLIFYLVSWLFGSVLLPEMIALNGAAERLFQFVAKWNRIVVFTMAPIAVAGFFLAPTVTTLLYGAPYAAAGKLASVMVLACPFIALNSIQMNLAFALNARHTSLGIFFAATLLTCFLDFLFGARYGMLGVAIAIVIREFAVFLGFWALRSRIVVRSPQLSVSESP
jgi:O-antigen/teichoic acid export membrane protein